jgi:trk system potassium uptake protein TrkH
MFIGAAPGSTGGGIKVTTFVVLLLLVRAVLAGREDVVVFGRKVERLTVLNAAVLAFLGILALTVSAIFLLATQPLPPGKILFEAFSAFGTVGLSLGVTSSLTPAGKLAVIFLMLFGRVGPLTVLVMMRPRKRPAVDYPTAKVMIG